MALARLRRRILGLMEDASVEVAAEAQLPMEPMSELLVVDRRTWVAGNVRTLRDLFGDEPIPGSDAKVVAWEAGLALGLMSRLVLAQYDPYRDLLIVVHPNLGEVAEGDALRWLVFHELTHLAQFRRAPWIREHIVTRARAALSMDDPSWVRDAGRRLVSDLPELIKWARASLAGEKTERTPIMELLPPGQREIVEELHALLTVLEGHATHVTDLVGRRLIPNYDQMQARIKASRRRPPVMRLLEAVVGIEMKRQQYVVGRSFCEAVWNRGGAEALAPFFEGPGSIPSAEEVRDPDLWMRRAGAAA